MMTLFRLISLPVPAVLGIDWTKRITHTPSGRDFVYIDPAAGAGAINFGEIRELFAGA
jgi:hypothetical protein